MSSSITYYFPDILEKAKAQGITVAEIILENQPHPAFLLEYDNEIINELSKKIASYKSNKDETTLNDIASLRDQLLKDRTRQLDRINEIFVELHDKYANIMKTLMSSFSQDIPKPSYYTIDNELANIIIKEACSLF